MTSPQRAALDAELAAAEDAVVRASSSLVDLEAHPGHRLAPGGFTGVSAQRREQTLATVAGLHRDLALHRTAVAAAREARGTRSRPTAEELAAHRAPHDDTVTVSEEAVPLQHRGLPGPTSQVTRTSADALLTRMTAASDAATAVAAAVAAVWDAVAAQLEPLEAEAEAEAEAEVAGLWTEGAAAAGLDAATRRADEDHELLAGLLDRRAELRGRLGALRAKASA